jgi:predicted ATPase
MSVYAAAVPHGRLFLPPFRFSELSTLIKSGAGLHGSSLPSGHRKAIQGLYMFGGVGCGKTMLMDLLVASAPKEFQVSTAALAALFARQQ